EFLGGTINEPAEAFHDLRGSRYGLSHTHAPEGDGVVREFPLERADMPSLPVAAAEALGKIVKPGLRENARFIGFYGPAGPLSSEPYASAFGRRDGYFKDKIVFIGGRPEIGNLGEKDDFLFTPFRRWGGEKMPGVELQATIFLNLLRNEWLTRLPPGR